MSGYLAVVHLIRAYMNCGGVSVLQSKKVAADCDEHSMKRVSAVRARSGCGRRKVGMQVSPYRHLTWALVAAIGRVGKFQVASQCWREQQMISKGLTVREEWPASRFQCLCA
jgi:hypothetical protein